MYKRQGVENVVASSGTALTQGQIRLIHRFTNNITVLYDGDAAGIKAALRGIDMLLEEGMNVKVVLLPAGEDPDSFARSHSASEFAEFISQNETDFIRFKTKLLLAEAGSDPIKRSALISDIIRTVAIIPDNIARSVYIRECSTTMEIDEQVLLNEVNKIRLNKEENQAAKSVRNTPPVQSPVNTIPEYPDFPGYQPYTQEEANTLLPENIPLDILYEDDDLLVVNKPKGMVVHPSAGHYTGTLVNAIMYHCRDSLSGINGEIRPGIVHRIDMDTTGSLIVCKNDESHVFIAEQIKEHSVNRRYRGIVYGVVKEEELSLIHI